MELELTRSKTSKRESIVYVIRDKYGVTERQRMLVDPTNLVCDKKDDYGMPWVMLNLRGAIPKVDAMCEKKNRNREEE